MTKEVCTLFIVIPLLLLVGCSTQGKIAEKYPQRFIDRPYTLPKGIKSWTTTFYHQQTIFDGSNQSDSSAEKDNENYVYPLNWQIPVTDDFSFVSAPLPLGVRHQIFKGESSMLGWNGAYFFFISMAQIDYQFKLSPNLAIKPYLNYLNIDFLIEETQTGYGADVMYQANDALALIFGIRRAKIEAGSDFFEDVFGLPDNSVIITDYISQYKIGAALTLDRQWDMSLSIQETSYDDATDDKLRLLTLDLVHYWD